MRAVLTNLGSTGDFWPFLALAVELRRHGHAPILAFPANFAAFAERYGIPFTPVGYEDPIEQFRDQAVALLEATTSLDQMRPLLEATLKLLPEMFRTLRDICSDADVIIGGIAQPAGRMVHDAIGTPFVSLHTTSFAIWGAAAPRQLLAPLINACRVREGLAPLHDPIIADTHSPQLALHAVSRYILRAPPSWPSHYHVVGYLFLDDETWQPDPALVEFLAAGDPPVVIGFGSAIHEAPERMTDLVLEAIRRVGCRAIIQRGWSGLGDRSLPSNVHVIDFVPHGWLFPRASCVVHHGATGTTGATLRAGVPAVFVPHAYEHPLNAEVVRELGCTGPPIPYRQLTAERLSAAITATLNTPRYYQAAAALGEKVRAEHGVQTARHLIEQLVSTAAGA